MENYYHLGLFVNSGKIHLCVLNETGVLTVAGTFENTSEDITAAVRGIEYFIDKNLIKATMKDFIQGVGIYHSEAVGDIMLAGQLLYLIKGVYTNEVRLEPKWVSSFNDVILVSGGEGLKTGDDDIQWPDLVSTCITLFKGVDIPDSYIPAACLTAISARYHS